MKGIIKIFKKTKKLVVLAVLFVFLVPYRLFILYQEHSWQIKPRISVPIVVVDEHHEVIPYWIKAVEQNVIGNSNNVLIHFDAHSDLGTPRYSSSMPNFEWPTEFTSSVIGALMESNDVFILSAVIMGLFDHVVWIYPKWTQERVAYYQSCQIGIGLTNLTGYQNSTTYCLCINCKETSKCVILVRGPENPEIVIRSDTCNVKRTFLFDTVQEDHIDEFLATRNLNLENALLDFDEDYYGVESPAVELVKKGINYTQVEALDFVLEDLFCPKSAREEKMASDILSVIIRDIIDCKQDQYCVPGKYYVTAVTELPKVLTQGDSSLICNDIDILTIYNQVMFVLLSFLPDELSLLVTTRFCLSSSPKFVQGNSFHVCHGLLVPDEIVVKLKQTDTAEISERTKVLETILQKFGTNMTPKFVTIARSVRDGYTPRTMYLEIEQSILSAIANSLHIDTGSNVLYDKDRLQL